MVKGKESIAYYPGRKKKEKKVIEKYRKTLRKKKVYKKILASEGPKWMNWPLKTTIN